jgi:hypothetical protein
MAGSSISCRFTFDEFMSALPRFALALVVTWTVCACSWSRADAAGTRASPRAEIQVALCGQPDAIERALELVPRGPDYETWLFDDADLSMLQRGLRIRLRVKPKDSELTVKIAAQDCGALAPGLVPKKEGKCEFDVHGEHIEGVVSLTRTLDASAVQGLIAGRKPMAQALSAAQVRYLRQRAGAWPLPTDLRALGPIANRVLETPDKIYDVDLSRLPGGEQYLEISIKVPRDDVGRARTALAIRLAQSKVEVCADQAGQAATKLRQLLQRR